MTSMKMMVVIFMAILFWLFTFKPSFAQIYKWSDEKGTVNFTDDPNKVPVKYKIKADTLDINPRESPPPTLSVRPETKAPSASSQVRIRRDQVPETPEQGKKPQYGRPLLSYDPANDPEYQQMINKLNKSIYYQRDIYQPGTQRVRHRAGELIPGGPATAQSLKEELDRLVSKPEFGRDTQYRKDVKNFFDSHFYERDEYFPRTQSIMHAKGEIKPGSSSREKLHRIDIEEDLNSKKKIDGATSMEPTKSIEHYRLFNPATGHFLTKQGDGYFDYKTSQTWKETGNGLFNPFTGERMNPTANGYKEPRTGQTWIKQ